MPNPVDSANLILKLYELRREETMRNARNFVTGFDPRSLGDIQNVTNGPHSAAYRMVTTYWEMAASFVTNGAIDAKMFEQAGSEHIFVFGKVQPFLPELRKVYGEGYMKNLEQVCAEAPGGLDRVAAMRERLRGIIAARAAAEAKA